MCEHCHEEEYNAVILNLEDQDLECGVITIFEMDGQDYIALVPMGPAHARRFTLCIPQCRHMQNKDT